MAITEKYVTTTGAGTNSGDDEANAYAWTHVNDAMTAGGSITAAAGWRFNIKAGTYSISSTDTFTVDGTTASPIIFRGYNSTIGDLDAVGRTSGNGALILTNFPVLSYASGTRLNASGSDNCIFQCLKVTVASTGFSGATLNLGLNGVAFRCYADNISTNSAAAGIGLAGAGAMALDCDAALTGASGGGAAIAWGANSNKVIACRVTTSQAAGIGCGAVTVGAVLVANCVVANCVNGIYYNGTVVGTIPTIINNTIYNCSTAGIQLGASGGAAFTGAMVVAMNHITDCGTAILSAYDATAQLALVAAFNRTRDNTVGIDGFDNWASATTWSHVTTDTGGVATDFTNAGGGDFTLIRAAPALGASAPAYASIGALQRQENYPAVGDVRSGTTYGPANEQTGTMSAGGGGSQRVICG